MELALIDGDNFWEPPTNLFIPLLTTTEQLLLWDNLLKYLKYHLRDSPDRFLEELQNSFSIIEQFINLGEDQFIYKEHSTSAPPSHLDLSLVISDELVRVSDRLDTLAAAFCEQKWEGAPIPNYWTRTEKSETQPGIHSPPVRLFSIL